MGDRYWLLLLVGWFGEGCGGGEIASDFGSPVLEQVHADSADIVWEADAQQETCLRYWPLVPRGEATVWQDCPVGGRYQVAKLENLMPGTHYGYQLVTRLGGEEQEFAKSNDVTSFEFRTADEPAAPFSFAVLGDSHGNAPILTTILDQLLADQPPVDFLLHTGDATNDGSEPGAWQADFISLGEKFLTRVPVHLVMGNHERGAHPPYLSRSKGKIESRQRDSWSQGNSYFILIDSNEEFAAGSEQYRWLEERLSSKDAMTARWLFVALHHPPFSEGWDECGEFDGDREARAQLVPLFTRYGVDMAFSGHTHGYERGMLDGVVYIISGGGGGELDRSCQDWEQVTIAAYLYHHLVVEVAGDRLTLRARTLDGTIIDRIDFTKR